MKGKIAIEIYNNRVHYKLVVKRNITVIQGDSATGKTELIRMLTDYEENGSSSGVTLIADKPCVVLNNRSWQERLATIKQSIVFVDEGADFMTKTGFAREVKGSDNYFVLITREPLEQLPYSIEEIYSMNLASDNKKYKESKKVYNELVPLYTVEKNLTFVPEEVITEDSGAGNDFYRQMTSLPCKTSNGKSNVLKELEDSKNNRIFAIVDGAAFGSEMARVMQVVKYSKKEIKLYAPESFEWLLLMADLVDHTSKVATETYEYADSKEFMSWEEFYSDYIVRKTSGTVYQYSKSSINKVYLTAGSKEKIKAVFPEQIRKIFNI